LGNPYRGRERFSGGEKKIVASVPVIRGRGAFSGREGKLGDLKSSSGKKGPCVWEKEEGAHSSPRKKSIR